jgi:hypothetical protein
MVASWRASVLLLLEAGSTMKNWHAVHNWLECRHSRIRRERDSAITGVAIG